MHDIHLANQQSSLAVDHGLLSSAVGRVLAGEGIAAASISLAIVDDATMHRLNLRHLEHDEPTDVLSFVLEPGPDGLEGEIILSADTAIAAAHRFGWSPQHELLLYAVHGALHLAGYGDNTAVERDVMRQRERHYLATFGLAPPDEPVEPAPTVLYAGGLRL
jgi:probable rRNA maturation factor